MTLTVAAAKQQLITASERHAAHPTTLTRDVQRAALAALKTARTAAADLTERTAAATAYARTSAEHRAYMTAARLAQETGAGDWRAIAEQATRDHTAAAIAAADRAAAERTPVNTEPTADEQRADRERVARANAAAKARQKARDAAAAVSRAGARGTVYLGRFTDVQDRYHPDPARIIALTSRPPVDMGGAYYLIIRTTTDDTGATTTRPVSMREHRTDADARREELSNPRPECPFARPASPYTYHVERRQPCPEENLFASLATHRDLEDAPEEQRRNAYRQQVRAHGKHLCSRLDELCSSGPAFVAGYGGVHARPFVSHTVFEIPRMEELPSGRVRLYEDTVTAHPGKVAGVVATVSYGRHLDRVHERRWLGQYLRAQGFAVIDVTPKAARLEAEHERGGVTTTSDRELDDYTAKNTLTAFSRLTRSGVHTLTPEQDRERAAAHKARRLQLAAQHGEDARALDAAIDAAAPEPEPRDYVATVEGISFAQAAAFVDATRREAARAKAERQSRAARAADHGASARPDSPGTARATRPAERTRQMVAERLQAAAASL